MIYVIGIGTGGRASLTASTLDIIMNSKLLAAGARHLAAFDDFKGEKVAIKGSLGTLVSAVAECVNKGGDAAVLATGDPLLFGIGEFIIKKFGKEAVEVIPNVSTVAEAFARVKESWSGAVVLSVHGGGEGKGIEELVANIRASKKAAVFTDPVTTPAVVARELMARGVTGHTAHVCESLGTKDEKVASTTLAALSRRRKFAPLNVLLLVKDAQGSAGGPKVSESSFGVPDAEFAHSAGMITKEEIRVVALSKLRIGESSVVWDIGSCTGSVAIEAARLAPAGHVVAVEKNRARIKDIVSNRKKFSVSNLEVIEGTAPECLQGRDLAPPDAVFVGGGGAGLTGILKYVAKKIRNGATVVVNAVTLETAHGAMDFFRKKGWAPELLLVSISRGRDINGLSMLSAHNPVFIITARRP